MIGNSLGSNDYQTQAMEREAARVSLRREQNEVRRVRYHNAKLRLIGVDVEGLDAQVAEKSKLKALREESLRQDRLNALNMERVLEEAALEDRRARMLENEALKKSWGAAADLRRALPPAPETDYAKCGSASAQTFSGEDTDRAYRIAAQKEQMREWCGEGKTEREDERACEAAEEERWASFVRETTLLREAAERRETELLRAHVAEVADTNRALAASQHARNGTRDTAFAMTSIGALNEEDLDKAMDEYGRITRRDMFRGFTAAQRARIVRDNEDIIRMRREALYSEQREDEGWVLQQLAQTRAMERVLYEERRARDEASEAQQRAHLEQARHAAERKRAELQDRRAGVSDEFFDKFGRDCR